MAESFEYFRAGIGSSLCAVSSNFETGQVCASVFSLSPFVVARLDATYQPATLFDTSKAFRSGSTIPVKVRLLDSSGGNVSSPLISVSAKRLRRDSANTTVAVQDAGNANEDRNFRYDPALGGYIFNLSSKGLAAATLLLDPEGCELAVLQGPAEWNSKDGKAVVEALIGLRG